MSSGNGSRSASRSRGSNGRAPGPAAVARRACTELAELLGRTPEGIVSLERGEDGWQIGIEVVEIRRVPDTADILARYEVDADENGQLLGYRRVRRYVRASVEGDE